MLVPSESMQRWPPTRLAEVAWSVGGESEGEARKVRLETKARVCRTKEAFCQTRWWCDVLNYQLVGSFEGVMYPI